MTEPDREDFERILLDVIPDEPTALSVVVEGFCARTQLDPLEARAAVVEGLRRMLLKAAPVRIGKATKKPRPDIEAAVIEELEVLFFDSESQGWLKLRASVLAELMQRWPEAASAPPGNVLLRSVTPEVSVFEDAQQVILLEAIPSVPTPLRAVIDEFQSRTGLRGTAARNRFFGIMAILVVSAAKDVGLDVMNITEVEIQEIQVRFADLPEDGWLPLSAHSMTHLSMCWPMLADHPPDGVLIRKSFLPARVNAAALKIA